MQADVSLCVAYAVVFFLFFFTYYSDKCISTCVSLTSNNGSRFLLLLPFAISNFQFAILYFVGAVILSISFFQEYIEVIIKISHILYKCNHHHKNNVHANVQARWLQHQMAKIGSASELG